MIQLYTATPDVVRDLIMKDKDWSLSLSEERNMEQLLKVTNKLFVGIINDEILGACGLAPTTLLSDRAYLWLYHTQKVASHEFLFIRHSRIFIQRMLLEYPVIFGVTAIENKKAIRWIEWLGGKWVGVNKTHRTFEIRQKEEAEWLIHSR